MVMTVALVLMANLTPALMTFCRAAHHLGVSRGGDRHRNEPQTRDPQNGYDSHARHFPHRP